MAKNVDGLWISGLDPSVKKKLRAISVIENCSLSDCCKEAISIFIKSREKVHGDILNQMVSFMKD